MYSLPEEDLGLIAARVESLWPRRKRFLISGGTGFMGRWLVESIFKLESQLKTENEFFIISRRSREIIFQEIPILKNSCFTMIQSNLQDFTKVEGTIHYVIDAASDVALTKAGQSQQINFSNSMEGTKNLLRIAVEKQVEKYLYVSSGGVYANSNGPQVESNFNPSKDSSGLVQNYNDAKRAAEGLVIKVAGETGLVAQIVRCFSFVGPYVSSQMAVIQFLQSVIRKKSIELSSPSAIRSYMHPVDMCVGLFQILLTPAKSIVFNLGSSQPVRLDRLIAEIGKATGTQPEVKLCESFTRSLAGQCYYPNTELIEKELKFQMQIQLPEALKKTWQFYKNKG